MSRSKYELPDEHLADPMENVEAYVGRVGKDDEDNNFHNLSSALQAGARVIYMEKGVFVEEEDLYLPSGLRVRGASKRRTVITGRSKKIRVYPKGSNITLENLTLIGELHSEGSVGFSLLHCVLLLTDNTLNLYQAAGMDISDSYVRGSIRTNEDTDARFHRLRVKSSDKC